MTGSKRRSLLGIGVAKNLGKTNLGIIDVVGNCKLDRNRWKLLRRSKQLLAMRTVSVELASRLDYREEWNKCREVKTVLDLFPSLKYSYSSLRGRRFSDIGAVKVLSVGGKTRIDDIARSHSIRLDPVDAPKQLFKYRQRIQKIIEWSYSNNLVPVMMTLTVYHRWKPLKSLCRVLRNAWSDLFRRKGQKRKQYLGLRGYIRRMEETFNDGEEMCATNAGWHPHYHIILIVPRENLKLLSDYEEELRAVWVKLVSEYYRQEFCEEIPAAYYESFKEHGLVLSRYKSDEHAVRCGNPNGKAGDLLEVHDGEYLAKIMGTDKPGYGGDNELTTLQKTSKTPFEMLRGKVTANLADLWCEYALATKKIPCFTFSRGLEKEVAEYYRACSAQDSLPPVEATTEQEVVARLVPTDYQHLHNIAQVGNLLEVAKQGKEATKTWLKESFNIDVLPDETADESNLETVDVVETSEFEVKVGVLAPPRQKRAKKCWFFKTVANKNKSPPKEQNKAPPKVMQRLARRLNAIIHSKERRASNGRIYEDSS